MTFDEEWADAQRTAAAGGSSYDLVVTQDDLGAVGHEAFLIHGQLRAKADIAGTGATARAATECSTRNLAMGSEPSATLSTWDSQVKTVLQMYAHISNHLDFSKKAHANDDEAIAAGMRHRGRFRAVGLRDTEVREVTLTWTDLITLDLGKLNEAVTEWKTAAEELAKLHGTVRDGLVKKSEAARWEGVNATVTREFVRSAAKEVDDLQREAKSIHLVLADAHAELTQIQKQAKALADEARRGDPAHTPEPDPGLLVSDGGGGKVRVESSICDAKGPNQRTQDMIRWYADTLTGLVSHAADVDAAATRALRASHGADPYNAGHAEYTSLDQDQLPRAMKLAALGKDAKPAQQAELRRLWQSLSPDARAQLWTAHRDDLIAAGLFNPSVKQMAADRGSGKHGAEDIEWNDWVHPWG